MIKAFDFKNYKYNSWLFWAIFRFKMVEGLDNIFVKEVCEGKFWHWSLLIRVPLIFCCMGWIGFFSPRKKIQKKRKSYRTPIVRTAQ